jgi:hypothetical protein
MKEYMEKPSITTKEVNNFNIWHETFDPNFTAISQASNIPKHWLSYQTVLSGPYAESIIKPTNLYVQTLVPPPQLISIKDGIVRLRQGNHAEIFLLQEDDGVFYNMDRPWIRQYYNTTQSNLKVPEGCFDKAFKFYVPWFIDANISVMVEPPETESPFVIQPQKINYYRSRHDAQHIEPAFVPFYFKRVGSHMVKDGFGKIPRQSAMFDLVFDADDIMVEKVRNFYEK